MEAPIVRAAAWCPHDEIPRTHGRRTGPLQRCPAQETPGHAASLRADTTRPFGTIFNSSVPNGQWCYGPCDTTVGHASGRSGAIGAIRGIPASVRRGAGRGIQEASDRGPRLIADQGTGQGFHGCEAGPGSGTVIPGPETRGATWASRGSATSGQPDRREKSRAFVTAGTGTGNGAGTEICWGIMAAASWWCSSTAARWGMRAERSGWTATIS